LWKGNLKIELSLLSRKALTKIKCLGDGGKIFRLKLGLPIA